MGRKKFKEIFCSLILSGRPLVSFFHFLWLFQIGISGCSTSADTEKCISYLPPDVAWIMPIEFSEFTGNWSTVNKWVELSDTTWLEIFIQSNTIASEGIFAAVDIDDNRYLLLLPEGAKSIPPKAFLSRQGVYGISTTTFKGIDVCSGKIGDKTWVAAGMDDLLVIGNRAVDVEGVIGTALGQSKSGNWDAVLALWADRAVDKGLYCFFPPDNKISRAVRNGPENWAFAEMELTDTTMLLSGQYFGDTEQVNQAKDKLERLLSIIPAHIFWFECRSDRGVLHYNNEKQSYEWESAWGFGGFDKDRIDFAVIEMDGSSLNLQDSSLAALERIDYQMFPIVQPLGAWSIPGVQEWQNPYICLLPEYAIICASKPELELWIDYYIVNKNIFDRPGFAKVAGPMLKAWNTFSFSNSAPSFTRNRTKSGYSSIGISHVEKEHLFFKYLIEKSEEAYSFDLIWRVTLDAPLLAGPFELGNNLWAVQDDNFLLQFFDSKGAAVFDKKLDGPLLSEVFSLRRKNGAAVFFAFNTSKTLYLLDQEGNDKSGFPVQLRANAKAGICITELDENGQFQFFLPSIQKSIYGFGWDGLPVPGWSPLLDSVSTDFRLLHTVLPEEDYLFAMDSLGHVRAYNRFGELKWAKKLNGIFRQNAHVQLFEGYNRVVAIDTSGYAHIVPLSGAEGFRVFLDMPADGKLNFLFDDIMGDSRKDYILAKGGSLKAYAYNGTQLNMAFSLKEKAFFEELFVLNWKGTQQIGAIDKRRQEVWAFDKNGRRIPGFPLKGDTKAINEGGVMIVGLAGQVYGYQVLQ